MEGWPELLSPEAALPLLGDVELVPSWLQPRAGELCQPHRHAGSPHPWATLQYGKTTLLHHPEKS